jgi:hypothetical protein
MNKNVDAVTLKNSHNGCYFAGARQETFTRQYDAIFYLYLCFDSGVFSLCVVMLHYCLQLLWNSLRLFCIFLVGKYWLFALKFCCLRIYLTLL